MTKTKLDKKINSLKCNCEIYCPFILNGPCRFCYGYK